MSLKYRTSAGTSASNFSDLVVKVGDTLPIGSEIDYDGQTAPAGWQEVDDPNVYSTTETRIGTWIDGKPLYRKVSNTSVSLQANNWTNLRYKSGEKSLIRCVISDCEDFYDSTSCLTYPVIARLYGNYIQIYSFINTTAKCVIVEYTKTTD